jgi:hypothetical protein
MKILSQDSWSPGRYLKPVPPVYEVEVLTTRPRLSVMIGRPIVQQITEIKSRRYEIY